MLMLTAEPRTARIGRDQQPCREAPRHLVRVPRPVPVAVVHGSVPLRRSPRLLGRGDGFDFLSRLSAVMATIFDRDYGEVSCPSVVAPTGSAVRRR